MHKDCNLLNGNIYNIDKLDRQDRYIFDPQTNK